MKRNKTIHTAAIAMLCLATLTTGACVTQRTYETATADLEVPRNPNSRAPEPKHRGSPTSQRPPTTQERPRESNGGRLDGARASHEGDEGRAYGITKTIEQPRSHDQAPGRSTEELAGRVQTCNQTAGRLQSAVDDYTSKLRPVDEVHASPTPPPAVMANEPVNTALIPPAQTSAPNEPAPKPTVTPTAASVNQPVANPIPPLAGQPAEPVEEDWLTFLKNWISSLWQSVVFF